MKTPCIFIGVGGHAKVLCDELPSVWELKVLLADASASSTDIAYFKALGVEVLEESHTTFEVLKRQGIHHAFVAIGDNVLRQTLTHQWQALGFCVPNFVSEQAYVAQTAHLGDYGIQILGGSHIGTNAHVANGCLINHHAILEHDGSLGVFSHLAPNAVMLGGARVGSSCLIGANATILPSIHITDACTIGAGSVVCHSVMQSGIYKGII